jgi:hypothetical protein
MKKYIVRLDAEEHARLEQLIDVGKAAAYRIRHANVLLAVDESDAGPKMEEQATGRRGCGADSRRPRPRRMSRLRVRPQRHGQLVHAGRTLAGMARGELDQPTDEARLRRAMKELADTHYPNATKIEVVHTPKHGSWLNMAECERNVLAKQCLGERLGDEATLRERASK